MPFIRRHLRIIIIAFTVLLLIEAAGYLIGKGGYRNSEATISAIENSKRSLPDLRARNTRLRNSIRSLAPAELYIVIDTGRNRLFLRQGDRTVHEAVISSGSGSILKDPAGKRQWVFDTPRGEYTIKTKYTSPVWTRPDWAFIEEGQQIPKNPLDRQEAGVLGDYALGFGNGYFIHGTLYTRLLGRNVTHGCIRVGDKDLKKVFNSAAIGTRLVIF